MSSSRPKRVVKNLRILKLDSESEVDDDDDFSEPQKKKKLIQKETKKEIKKISKKELIEEVKNVIPENSNKVTKSKDVKSVKKEAHLKSKLNYDAFDVTLLLSESTGVEIRVTKQIIELFKNDNTIPFICRYRREVIGDHMTPEMLREFKNSYGHYQNLGIKIENTFKTLEKREILDNEMKANFLKVKDFDELDLLYAPFKTTGKKTLAERACALGLEPFAKNILYGEKEIYIHTLINTANADLDVVEKVEEGLRHIIANLFSKNTHILEEIRKLQKTHRIFVEVKRAKIMKSAEKNKQPDPKDITKFENYFEYSNNVSFLKSHQVLAINRGEHLKILSVKIVVPDSLKYALKRFIEDFYLKNGLRFKLRYDLIATSFEEAFAKKFQPLISRQIRSELTKEAEKASINVFATNLKQLLLMSPVRGEKILGIDPGFTMGCKCALIDECNNVLDSLVIYPHTNQTNWIKYGEDISRILNKTGCNLIALGNGTACRETEEWLAFLYDKHIIDSDRVKYCIVSEQGASIYSCSSIARKEFPKLDVNLISAVSIARRLSDPLCELVKVEPKHLGVGMYQHDINEKELTETLNEVVVECVSYVGIDINTASVSLLSHVAGLTQSRAENIIEHRQKNGPFKTRKDILKVKMIGEKTYTQCAGFIRIDPITAAHPHYNILDSTWVHPESYNIADDIMSTYNLYPSTIGSPMFIKTIKTKANEKEYSKFSLKFKQPEERIKSVFEALQRDITRDYRSDFNKKPLFKQGLTKMSDLTVGTIVSGAVTNIVDFGSFVDIGVECNGLIHSSKMNGMTVNIGDRVQAKVLNVEQSKRRIGLLLERIL